jgi:hypothetical protein
MNDQERVTGWLRRHRVRDLELTPLVVARVAVRDRYERAKMGTYLALLAVLGVAWVIDGSLTGWSLPEETPATSVLAISLGFLMLGGVTGMVFWLQRRADQRVAQGLRQRVSRSQATTLATILGGRNLRIMLVVHGGGILIGAACAALATTTAGRMLGLAFAAGAIMCSGVVTWVVADVVCRPVVADDEPSLRADELLRRMDAGDVLFPYPMVLAAVAVTNSGAGSALTWAFLGYAAAALVVWAHTTWPAAPAGVGPGARA